MSEQVEVKKVFWKSKTFWASVVTGALGYIPGVQDFLVANPEAVTSFLGVLFAVLRFVTKDKIVIG